MIKYNLYKYTATAESEPENLYKYAAKNGSAQLVWVYRDILDALKALPNFETKCQPTEDGRYQVVCYAVEEEEW